MPQGSFERIHQYILKFKNNKLQKIGNAPGDCLKEILSYKYQVRWTTTYEEPKLYQGVEYYNNFYACLGTKDMAKEILTAFGDVKTWKVLPPGDYRGGYSNGLPDASLWGEPFYMNIFTAKKGGTYIAVPEYLVFYSTDNNIVKRILKVAEKYPNQWRIDNAPE